MDTNSQQPDGQRRVRRRSLDGFDAVLESSRTGQVFPAAPAGTPTASVPAPTRPEPQMVTDFPLPRYRAPDRPRLPVRKRTSKKTIALRTASLMVVAMLMTGGFLTWKGYAKFHKVFHGTSTVAALTGKQVAPDLLNGEGDGRVNILLLGIGGPGHDGPDLTDTMVVMSVDPVNDTAVLLSIPRDLWVKMPVNYVGSQQKINAAYESGKYHYLGKMDASSANAAAVEAGFAADDQVVKDVLGVNINYHVLINFQAFRQAIDTVGGVTVDVPTELNDPTMAWENNWNPILAEPGVQQMDGVKALLYARSRETTSDFARSQRQRQILVALKDKVLTAGTLSNPTKIDGLMNAFGDNVYSDLSTQGAMRLVSIIKQVSDNHIASIGLTDPPHQLITTDHVGNISVDRPVAGFNNYTDIQNYVRSQLPDGYLLKEKAPITVEGATAAGAQQMTDLLKEYGYNVTATVSTEVSVTKPAVVDLSDGKDPYTLHYLEMRYGKSLKQLPVGISVQPGSAKFVIMSP